MGEGSIEAVVVGGGGSVPNERKGETPKEREIRHMNDLLQELRVILPGVQVLFAFLLVVVFSRSSPKLPRSNATCTSLHWCVRRYLQPS